MGQLFFSSFAPGHQGKGHSRDTAGSDDDQQIHWGKDDAGYGTEQNPGAKVIQMAIEQDHLSHIHQERHDGGGYCGDTEGEPPLFSQQEGSRKKTCGYAKEEKESSHQAGGQGGDQNVSIPPESCEAGEDAQTEEQENAKTLENQRMPFFICSSDRNRKHNRLSYWYYRHNKWASR